jgi:hypothetical protein
MLSGAQRISGTHVIAVGYARIHITDQLVDGTQRAAESTRRYFRDENWDREGHLYVRNKDRHLAHHADADTAQHAASHEPGEGLYHEP